MLRNYARAIAIASVALLASAVPLACQPALPRPAEVADACAPDRDAFTCSVDGSRVLVCTSDDTWQEDVVCDFKCAFNRIDDPQAVCCIADSQNEEPTQCFPDGIDA